MTNDTIYSRKTCCKSFGLTGNFNPVYASYTFVSCMRFVSGRLIKRSKSTMYILYTFYTGRVRSNFLTFLAWFRCQILVIYLDSALKRRMERIATNSISRPRNRYGDVNSCIPDREITLKNWMAPTQLYECATYTLRLFTSIYNNFSL